MNQTTATKPFHYFASTCFNWATADTLEEAVKKVASVAPRGAIQAGIARHEGLYCITYRVELPKTANYRINLFVPIGVPTSEEQHHRIVSSKGAYITTTEGTTSCTPPK